MLEILGLTCSKFTSVMIDLHINVWIVSFIFFFLNIDIHINFKPTAKSENSNYYDIRILHDKTLHEKSNNNLISTIHYPHKNKTTKYTKNLASTQFSFYICTIDDPWQRLLVCIEGGLTKKSLIILRT